MDGFWKLKTRGEVSLEFMPRMRPSRFSHQHSTIKTSVSTQWLLVLILLLLLLPVVEAVEARDAIAVFLGVVLSITGICACLGVCAQKRNGQI
ncbi:small integral membrane protein 30-like [Hylobates moloch]|uniref:small integral membrane protein 30-like n=1 Tax=Hylobates moloch TaxID=81572 RepID=UPI0013F1E940|nr:small integral membrane protein 30-like [Hylobates moloch]